MPRPRLDDDGQAVTLDLHGATVAEATALALRALHLAKARGRASITFVHGSSTSYDPARRTIKRALHDLVDDGRLVGTQARRERNRLVLALDLTARRNPRRIRLRDVMP
jgi:DNA-nicking Smr family endonuclease